jgi:carbon storage regulator CsrA
MPKKTAVPSDRTSLGPHFLRKAPAMLILSRKQGQKIVFPTVAATVQIVRVQGNTVRLGIDAPDDLPVVREELLNAAANLPRGLGSMSSSLEHLLRNQLQTTSVGLALLRGQISQGLLADAEVTIERLCDESARLRDRFNALDRPQTLPKITRNTALLVEDNANERELLAGFLRLAGFEVATAGDGADALDYLATQKRPDVMLLDMKMPRCDGLTTVQRIRSTPALAGLKIYAVTGATATDLKVQANETGVDCWFAKPVDPEHLVQTIRHEFQASPASA